VIEPGGTLKGIDKRCPLKQFGDCITVRSESQKERGFFSGISLDSQSLIATHFSCFWMV